VFFKRGERIPMLIRTEGIVLKTQRYGEADLIVNYLTPDRGIIKAFAKSPRKTGSRFGSSLEPLTHSKISLYGKEHSDLKRLTQSDIIHSFARIREDYRDFIQVSRLMELILSLTPSGAPSKQIFSFLLNALRVVESSKLTDKRHLHLILLIRSLSIMGYAPRLNGCGRCGIRSTDFYPDAGAMLCDRCAGETAHHRSKITISVKSVRFYEHCLRWPIQRSERLRPDQTTIDELSSLIDVHLDFILSKRLNSSEFAKAVKV